MKPTQERIDELMLEHGITLISEQFYNFATLAYEAGRKDENEVCAELVVQCSWNVKGAENALLVDGCAAAIRARREQ